MTHALGTGSVNITYNAPADEGHLLGRTAFERNQARSELMREIIAFWFQHNQPDAAQRLRAIRESYYGAVQLLVLIASLFFGVNQEMVRPARVARKNETVWEV